MTKVQVAALVAISLVVGVAVGVLAAPKAPPAPDVLFPTPTLPVLATHRDGKLGAEAVHRLLGNRDPSLEPKYATPEGRAELLETVVREELLVREAVRRRLHEDPEVLASLRATLVQRLIQREFDQNDARKKFTEPEILAAYQANVGTYLRPELRQFSHLFRPATEPKARAQAKTELTALKAKLQREEVERPGAFARAVQAAGSPDGGDASLGVLTRADLQKRYPELVDAAWRLEQVGNIEGPFETPAGLHLLRLEVRYPEVDLSVDKVRDQLRSRLWFEQRPKQMEAYYKQLRDQAGVQVDAAALEAVLKEARPKASEARATP